MRWSVAVVLLVVPLLAGCLGAFEKQDRTDPNPPADVGYDPTSVQVTSVLKSTVTISSFDGVNLAAIIYEPRSPDLASDGKPPRWPVAIFVHGWGQFKETFEGVAGTTGAPIPADSGAPQNVNHLQTFAEKGILAVAYDARGFGQSGGETSVAGPAEMADLDRVLAFVEARHKGATNGFVGVIGGSYGGGQAYLAWADNPRITTAAAMAGWVDLYEALLQGNVPKLEWANVLYASGAASSRARYSPMIHEWYENAATRTDMDTVRAQMDARSILTRMQQVEKPLFVCQGLQESLFPQADLAWDNAGGFTRAYISTGGHGHQSSECWSRALDWFLYFLAGFDTGVDKWPALITVDADGQKVVQFDDFPAATWHSLYLRHPALDSAGSNTSFVVQQRGATNPFQEPSVVWDQLGQSYQQVPVRLRQDPNAIMFEGPKTGASAVLLGAPELVLHTRGEPTTPFQVAAILYHVDAQDRSRILSRAAYAALDAGDVDNGTITLRFHWTKAEMAPGERLVLKLGANDSSWWSPLTGNYAVEFTGQSELRLPYFEG